MSQKITVTKVEDHYEMQFDGGNAYPVPTNAIEKLDDEFTPEEVGASVTFEGDYGGHKHAKSFDVEDVIDGLDDGNDEEETDTDADGSEAAEPTPEHVAEVGQERAAGQAQQAEAKKVVSGGGDRSTGTVENNASSGDTEEDESDGNDSAHMFATDDSQCRRSGCESTPDMAADCDTGQTKYYCNEHAGGPRAGNARVDEWREA